MKLTFPSAFAAAAATTFVVAGTATAVDGNPWHRPGQPSAKTGQSKNIILLIGDGMGVTHIDAARHRFHGAKGQLHLEKAQAFGAVSTYAVERGSDKPNYVTDSASAATAWSSGVKTYNAALGKDAYGTTVETIMEQAKKAGLRTGNVSTAEITDATPAGQMSHVTQRGCQGPDVSSACEAGDVPVAEQIARNDVADVILGGGLSRFEPDDQAAMEANGYEVLGSFGDPGLSSQTAASQQVATKGDLAGVPSTQKKVIGLFNRGNLTVERFKQANPDAPQAQEPTLPEMTRKAIGLLNDRSRGSKGFFLQVEGALIDKRSHANDAAQTLEEMRAFDEAVKAAYEFAAKDGNTLVIVTADHECAGFNIVEKGSFTNAEAAGPPTNVDSGNTANTSTPARSGGNVKDPARTQFAPATFRTPDDPEGVADGDPAASLWLTYLSGNHTGADVNIYAYGRGSALFDMPMDNTDIFHKMRASLKGL